MKINVCPYANYITISYMNKNRNNFDRPLKIFNFTESVN